ncbi:MAG: PilZ domain-containing protein [Candidatus Omnitrophica bacterium]|nr:PilZ domain-containing protein [Candidatus Omnitrophota bacterium]
MNEGLYGYRRAYQRFSCFLKGKCESGAGKPQDVSCNDISYKGAGVIAAEPLTINSNVRMQLFNAKSGLIEVGGRVCWCNNVRGLWRCGISFDKILPFNLDKII